MEFPIDASYISVVATANDISHLPAPLLSRFLCLEVLPPDAAGRRVMAETVYAELRVDEPYGKLFAESLLPDVADFAATQQVSGRDIKRAMRFAMERACLALENDAAEDQKLTLHPMHFRELRLSSTRRMGFTG